MTEVSNYERDLEQEVEHLRGDLAAWRQASGLQHAFELPQRLSFLTLRAEDAEDTARIATRERDEARTERDEARFKWGVCGHERDEARDVIARARKELAHRDMDATDLVGAVFAICDAHRGLLLLNLKAKEDLARTTLERDATRTHQARISALAEELRSTLVAERKALGDELVQARKERDAAQDQCAEHQRDWQKAEALLARFAVAVRGLQDDKMHGYYPDIDKVEKALDEYDARVKADAPPPVDWKARAEKAEAVVEVVRRPDCDGAEWREDLRSALAAYDAVKP